MIVAPGLRTAPFWEFWELVDNHDRRIADLDLGVPDLPIGLRHTHQLRCSKRLHTKLYGAGRGPLMLNSNFTPVC